MFIYSQQIIQFTSTIKQRIKEILSREVGLKVCATRFYNRSQRTSYPIHVVIYNNKSMLGYFDSSFYELGFHASLLNVSEQQLTDIIRHELAHYITFVEEGETEHPHGKEFKAFCSRMHWGPTVARATICIENEEPLFAPAASDVLRKVQKLMALSTSSNPHEAQQAMIKSQQLLLKHNIEHHSLHTEKEETIYLKRVLKQPKENAKIRSIARILETFFVGVVYNRAQDGLHLEIIGNAVNVEIADYVAHFLQVELDNLWEEAQRTARLKGTIAKNSFLLGIAKGYCNKIAALKQECTADTSRALMLMEKQLTKAKAMVYPRLSSSRSSGGHCGKSSSLGEKMGRSLTINPSLNQSSQGEVAKLIRYFKKEC